MHLATIAHVAFHLATIGQVAFLPSKNSQSTGWSVGGSLCRNASSSFQVAKVLEQFVQSTLLLLPGKLTAGNERLSHPMKPREIHFLKSGGDPVYFHPCLCKEVDFSVNQVLPTDFSVHYASLGFCPELAQFDSSSDRQQCLYI